MERLGLGVKPERMRSLTGRRPTDFPVQEAALRDDAARLAAAAMTKEAKQGMIKARPPDERASSLVALDHPLSNQHLDCLPDRADRDAMSLRKLGLGGD